MKIRNSTTIFIFGFNQETNSKKQYFFCNAGRSLLTHSSTFAQDISLKINNRIYGLRGGGGGGRVTSFFLRKAREIGLVSHMIRKKTG